MAYDEAMRRLFCVVLLVAGCGGGSSSKPDGGGGGEPISLQFSQITGVMPALPASGYSAAAGTASAQGGVVTLDSKSGNVDLLIMSDNPTDPITIPIGEYCLVVNYTLTDDGGNAYAWGSSLPQGGSPGTVKFETTTSPYKVTISNMQMIAATAGTSGSFYINGEATFD